jgi:hypothetical protein
MRKELMIKLRDRLSIAPFPLKTWAHLPLPLWPDWSSAPFG